VKQQLLIVDDEPEIREMLERYFRMQGYETTVAADGVEGLAALADGNIRVIISDIMMPNMDGIEMLRRISSDFPFVRVIMITGYVTLLNALSCMRHGARTCVFKPLSDLTELSSEVDGAFQELERWEAKLMELRGLKPEVAEVP